MRISDWSSDVCSSDLQIIGVNGLDALRIGKIERDAAPPNAIAKRVLHDEAEPLLILLDARLRAVTRRSAAPDHAIGTLDEHGRYDESGEWQGIGKDGGRPYQAPPFAPHLYQAVNVEQKKKGKKKNK